MARTSFVYTKRKGRRPDDIPAQGIALGTLNKKMSRGLKGRPKIFGKYSRNSHSEGSSKYVKSAGCIYRLLVRPLKIPRSNRYAGNACRGL